MKIIRELSKIITPKRTKHVNLLSFNLKTDSKLMQLYEGVKSGRFESDEEAIISLYGSLEHKYKYSKLKYDLRKRLYNTIHLVELEAETFDDDIKTTIECQKVWTSVKFLISAKAFQSAIDILEKYFPKMLKYELTSMTIEGARILRKCYSTFALDVKKQQYYDLLLKDYLSLYAAEVEIDGYYNHLMSMYAEDKSPKKEVASIATNYLEALDAVYPKVVSSTFISLYKLIEIIKYMSQYDYMKTIEICDDAIETLRARKVRRKIYLMLIYSQAIACHLQLKEYETAEQKCLETLNNHLKEGEFNWFKIKELQLQNSIYSASYQRAYLIYLDSINHKSFKRLPSTFKEEWRIYSAYLEILIFMNLISRNDTNEHSRFRVNKFLNEVPVFSKDKKGRNITILIAQLVLFVVKERYNKVINKMEAIEKYVSRHLKKDYHHRTIIFIKIIRLFVKAGFERRMMDWEKLEILNQELSEKPLNIINPNYDAEIIRYEKLVEFVVACVRSENTIKVNKMQI
ncbi:MAG: hypothetical protein AAF806_26530 [Bacteroidota bacterium]